MRITLFDKCRVLSQIFKNGIRLPVLKQRIELLFHPLDIVRLEEFVVLLRLAKEKTIVHKKILDVSSPFIMSYLLSRRNTVMKTDINIAEKAFIRESDALAFEMQDATRLSYHDNEFDLTYSISVIEHVYQRYPDAINEMIRVTKPGGYLYLTFPVSRVHAEEWIEEDIYSHQHKERDRVFFQYRFDGNDVEAMLRQVRKACVISKHIYWERQEGGYDRVIACLRSKVGNKYVNLLKNAVINYLNIFNLLSNESGDFSSSKSFGNMAVILQKTEP